jgi:hypothetical protein
MNWRPFDDFTLNGGVAYTDAIVVQFNALRRTAAQIIRAARSCSCRR